MPSKNGGSDSAFTDTGYNWGDNEHWYYRRHATHYQSKIVFKKIWRHIIIKTDGVEETRKFRRGGGHWVSDVFSNRSEFRFFETQSAAITIIMTLPLWLQVTTNGKQKPVWAHYLQTITTTTKLKERRKKRNTRTDSTHQRRVWAWPQWADTAGMWTQRQAATSCSCWLDDCWNRYISII